MTLLLLLKGASPLTTFRLLPGTSIEISSAEVANKVYVVVEGSSPLVTGTATNTTVAPTYANSPREMLATIKAGDATAAAAVAAAHLTLRQETRYRLTGLQIRLRDGLAIERGTKIAVTVPRAGIAGTYAVRRLEHDFGSGITSVDVGEYVAPRDDLGAYVRMAEALAQLEKEAAI